MDLVGHQYWRMDSIGTRDAVIVGPPCFSFILHGRVSMTSYNDW